MPKWTDLKSMQIGNRSFSIYITKYSNGCFLSLSESETDRLGSLFLSVKTFNKIDSITIIPGKYGDVFSTILSQMIASSVDGIAIVSLFFLSEVDDNIMKVLTSQIQKLLVNEKRNRI